MKQTLIKWISVEESLPPPGSPRYENDTAEASRDVLVWVEHPKAGRVVGWRRGKYLHHHNLGWQVDGFGGWVNGGSDGFKVTHWAFVNVPKGKKEEQDAQDPIRSV